MCLSCDLSSSTVMTERPSVTLALRLCALGLLINCQPSEPYLTAYLYETKNLTEMEVDTEVYPWSTTGSFLLLLPLALLAEVVGSRPVILFGILCREATRVILIFGEGVAWMAVMQCTYAGGTAVNAIYFAYVYTVVPETQFAAFTSLVLASYHVGNVGGALLSQLLVDCVPGVRQDLRLLFYLSWGFTTLGALAFFLLPPPKREAPPALAATLLRRGVRDTCREIAALCAPVGVTRWLPWWVLGYSAQSIAGNYFQPQLSQLGDDVPYGWLESAVELALVAGALLALCLERTFRAAPAAFLASTSLARAVAYAAAAWGARAGVAAAPFACNVLASALHSLQRATGSAMMAHSIRGSQ